METKTTKLTPTEVLLTRRVTCRCQHHLESRGWQVADEFTEIGDYTFLILTCRQCLATVFLNVTGQTEP